jgi:hypothetical protein
LGVAEEWRYNGENVRLLRLAASGKYEPAETSRAFLALPIEQINHVLDITLKTTQHIAAKAIRDWIRTQGMLTNCPTLLNAQHAARNHPQHRPS